MWIFLLMIVGCQAHQSATTQPSTQPVAARISVAELFGIAPSDLIATTRPTSRPMINPEATMAYMEGRLARINGEYGEAIGHLRKAIELDGEHLSARKLLAEIYYDQGRFAEAKKHAVELLKLSPDDIVGHRVLGEVLIHAKQVTSGGRHLYRVLLLADRAGKEQSETALWARFVLGRVLAKQKYIRAAVQIYRPLLKYLERYDETSMPRSLRVRKLYNVYRPGLYLLVAKFYAALNELESAEPFYLKAQEFATVRTAARIGLIDTLHRLGSPERARELLDKFASAGPVDDNIFALYRQLYPADEWVLSLLAAYQPTRENIQVGVRLARELVTLQQWPEAAKLLETLVAMDPNDRAAVRLLVQSHRQLEQMDRCAEILIDALSSGSYVGAFAFGLAEPWDGDTAVELSDALERISVDAEKAFAKTYLRGLMAQVLGELTKADGFYRQSIELKPAFVPGYLARGNLLLLERRWAAAVKLADQSLEKTQATGGLLYLKGRALSELDRLKTAIKTLERARALNPQSDQIYLALAEAYLRYGRSPEAIKVLQEAFENALAGRSTVSELVQILIHANEPTRAGQVLKRYQQRFGPDSQYELLKAKLDYSRRRDRRAYQARLEGLVGKTARPGLVRVELAELAYESGDYDKAIEIARTLIDTAGEKAKTILWPRDHLRIVQVLAFSHHRRLEFEKALQAMKMLLRDWPERIRFQTALATMSIDAGQFEQAETVFNKLLDRASDPDRRLTLQKQIVFSRLTADDLPGAVALVKTYLQTAKGTSRTELQDLLLACYLRKDRYGDAIKLLDRLLVSAAGPRQRKCQRIVIETLIEQGKHEQAMSRIASWLGQSKAKDRDFVEALKISVYLKQQKFDEAIKLTVSKRASAKGVEKQAMIMTLIECYKQAERYEDAERLIGEQLADHPPGSPMARTLHYLLIRTWAQAGKFDQATTHIESELKKASASAKPVWQQWLFAVYFTSGQVDKAIKELEKLLRREPNLVWANNSLGYFLADRNRDLDRAEKLIRKALSAEPGTAAYLDSLAWVLYRRGNLPEAKKYAVMALRRMHRSDPVLLDHLADITAAMGDLDQAREYWQRALKLSVGLDAIATEPGLRERLKEKLKHTATQPSASSKTEPAENN